MTKEYITEGDNVKEVETVERFFRKDQLIQERDAIQQRLDEPEPSNEELIEMAKGNHPFYDDITRETMQRRIDKINQMLGIKK